MRYVVILSRDVTGESGDRAIRAIMGEALKFQKSVRNMSEKCQKSTSCKNREVITHASPAYALMDLLQLMINTQYSKKISDRKM